MNARTIAARAWQVRPDLLELAGIAVVVALVHVVAGVPLVLLVPATLACLAVAAAWTATVELREEQRHHPPAESGGEPS